MKTEREAIGMDQNEKDEKLQDAMTDLSVIRQTMTRSRVPLNRLSILFFIYGGVQLLLMGAFAIWNFVSTPVVPISMAHQIVWGFLWGYHIAHIGIAIVYFIWRRKLKRTDNNYTLYVYDMWGYALFVVPSLWLLCSLANLCFPQIINMDTKLAMLMLFWLVEQMMFFVGLAVTGFLLNSEDWKILSVLFIFAHLLSFVFGSGISNEGIPASDLFGHWFSIVGVWTILCGAISIILAIWFRVKRLRDFPN